MRKFDIIIGNDHAGYEFKIRIIEYLNSLKLKIFDVGSHDVQIVDYPDYAAKVTNMLIEGEAQRGILICGSGIGMSIAANRRTGIRAALCTNDLMAERSRAHNNANILVLGSLINSEDQVKQMINKFLNTQFEGGRHNVRLNKIK